MHKQPETKIPATASATPPLPTERGLGGEVRYRIGQHIFYEGRQMVETPDGKHVCRGEPGQVTGYENGLVMVAFDCLTGDEVSVPPGDIKPAVTVNLRPIPEFEPDAVITHVVDPAPVLDTLAYHNTELTNRVHELTEQLAKLQSELARKNGLPDYNELGALQRENMQLKADLEQTQKPASAGVAIIGAPPTRLAVNTLIQEMTSVPLQKAADRELAEHLADWEILDITVNTLVETPSGRAGHYRIVTLKRYGDIPAPEPPQKAAETPEAVAVAAKVPYPIKPIDAIIRDLRREVDDSFDDEAPEETPTPEPVETPSMASVGGEVLTADRIFMPGELTETAPDRDDLPADLTFTEALDRGLPLEVVRQIGDREAARSGLRAMQEYTRPPALAFLKETT